MLTARVKLNADTKADMRLKKLAPQVGLEPTTLRLTAECSAIELLRNKRPHIVRKLCAGREALFIADGSGSVNQCATLTPRFKEVLLDNAN